MKEHRFIIAEQLRHEIEYSRRRTAMLEPIGRNTAPAAAASPRCRSPRLISPSTDAADAVGPHDRRSRRVSHRESSVCRFGRTGWPSRHLRHPSRARRDRLWLYSSSGGALASAEGCLRRRRALSEKPDAATPPSGYGSNPGDFFWNSGIFLSSPPRIYLSRAANQLHPDDADILPGAALGGRAARRRISSASTRSAFAVIARRDSIDYAVMEHTAQAAVVPVADMGWSDLGSWDRRCGRSADEGCVG